MDESSHAGRSSGAGRLPVSDKENAPKEHPHEWKEILVPSEEIWLGLGTPDYMARLGRLMRVLCSIDCWTFGGSASPERDRVHCIHRCTFCRAVCGLLRKVGTAEMALGR